MPAISPLASWSDQGMPARPQYSSVRRGSNMRRKLTLPVEPPVRDDHRLARPDVERRAPLLSTAMPSTRPAFGASRCSAVMRCCKQDLARRPCCAAASSGRIRPLPEDMVACTAGSAGLPVCTIGQSIDRGMHLARHRVADGIAASRVGRLIDEDHAMRHQPFEGGDAVVGEGADDLAIVVAVIGKAVRFDHRPIGQIAEQQVGRVLDAVLLLRAGAAAERNIAAAGDGVAADIASRPRRGSPMHPPPARRSPPAVPVAPEPITTTSASRSHLIPAC